MLHFSDMRAALSLLSVLVLALALVAPAEAGADAAKKLDLAIAAGDEAAAIAAIGALAAEDDEAAAKAIVAGTVRAAGTIDLEPAALEALAGMKSEAARRYLAKGARSEKHWPARFLLVAALARLGTPDAEDAVIAALEDREPLVGAAAVGHLSRNATKATVGKLIAALPRLDKEKRLAPVRREVAGALRDLLGLEIEATQDWKNWWDSHAPDRFELLAREVARKAGERGGGDDVVSRLRENHPADYRTVERLSKEDILVFRGRSDRTEQVLEALRLPHTVLERAKLAETKLDSASQVLVFNCNGSGDPLSDDEVKRIRDFVEAGGYFFSSDWELRDLTSRAFPGKVERAGSTPNDETVEVKITAAPEAAGHAYLRDVFPLDPFQRASFAWKLHKWTHLVKLGDGVTPLIVSEELAKLVAERKDARGKKAPAGKGPAPVAVTFRYGGGAVLHVLSHFQDQRTKEGDGFALQQLLLNFIVEKQKSRAKLGS